MAQDKSAKLQAKSFPVHKPMAMLVLTGLLVPALSSAQGDYERLLSAHAAPYHHYIEGGDDKGSSYQAYLQDSMANVDQYGKGARSGSYENLIARYRRILGEPLPAGDSEKPSGAEHPQVSFAGKEVSTSGSDKAGFVGYLDFAMHSQGFRAAGGDYEKYVGPYPESLRGDEQFADAETKRAEAARSLGLGLAARQTGSGLAELTAEDQEQQIQRLNSELASERAHLKKELETEKQRLRQELADEAEEQSSVRANAGYENAHGPAVLATIPVGKKPLLVGAGTLAAGMLVMTFAVRRLWFQHHLPVTEAEEHLLYVEAPLDVA